MRTDASWVPRSTTSCPTSASSTACRSATPRWSNATATRIRRVSLGNARGWRRRRTHGQIRTAAPAKPTRPPTASQAMPWPHVLKSAATSAASCHSLQQRHGARDDVVDVEAEPLEHGRTGSGRAEALERDRVAVVADPLPPAEGDTRLDRDPRPHVRRQHLVAVVRFLQLEELPAGHRDDADVRAVLVRDPPSRLEREADLRAGGDQDQVWRTALPERVGAAFEPARRSDLRPVERGHGL